MAPPAQPAGLLPEAGGFAKNLEKRLEGFSATASEAVEDLLQQMFFDLLGPAGLNLLILQAGKGGDTSVVDVEDVDVVLQVGERAAAGKQK